MVFIGCESGLDVVAMTCQSGFVAYDPVASSGVDYVVAGQYFGAAFIVSAMLILGGLSIRILLQLIKR